MEPLERDAARICRHYLVVTRNAECEAEVSYADLQIKIEGHLPDVRNVCMGRRPGCEKYQPYTAEEIVAQEVVQADRSHEIAIARQAILAKTRNKRNVWGSIPCPVCNAGTLKYSVSMWYGHIRAKCSTPACCDWNENEPGKG